MFKDSENPGQDIRNLMKSSIQVYARPKEAQEWNISDNVRTNYNTSHTRSTSAKISYESTSDDAITGAAKEYFPKDARAYGELKMLTGEYGLGAGEAAAVLQEAIEVYKGMNEARYLSQTYKDMGITMGMSRAEIARIIADKAVEIKHPEYT